jgi:thymidylate kinase
MFLAIEGFDGVGKTTLALRLASALDAQILEMANLNITSMSEKIETDRTYIAVRYLISNYCFFGIVPKVKIPDLTFVLSTDRNIIEKRIKERNINDEDLKTLNMVDKYYDSARDYITKFNPVVMWIDASYSSPDEITLKIANAFRLGLLAPKDYAISFKIFSSLAQTNPFAALCLGWLFACGDGTEQNFEIARKWLNHSMTFGVKNIFEVARQALEKIPFVSRDVITDGDVINDEACYYKYTLKEYEKAFELFLQAREAGSVIATYNLAIALLLGQGTEQNFEEAKKLFNEAYKNGNIWSRINLLGLDLHLI